MEAEGSAILTCDSGRSTVQGVWARSPAEGGQGLRGGKVYGCFAGNRGPGPPGELCLSSPASPSLGQCRADLFGPLFTGDEAVRMMRKGNHWDTAKKLVHKILASRSGGTQHR